jgi:hypothetical protein
MPDRVVDMASAVQQQLQAQAAASGDPALQAAVSGMEQYNSHRTALPPKAARYEDMGSSGKCTCLGS